MGVEAVAQVLHHALSEQARQVRLANADRAAEDRDRDHDPNQHVEEMEVRVAAARLQRLVEDLFREQRVDDAETRRDEDREADERDPPPVGAKQASDAADQTATRSRLFSCTGQQGRLSRRRKSSLPKRLSSTPRLTVPRLRERASRGGWE